MSTRVIPLTKPGALWSQREYIACLAMGIGFAAHRAGVINQLFHYGFPDGINCTTVEVSPTSVVRYVDHPFSRSDNWIAKCRAEMALVHA